MPDVFKKICTGFLVIILLSGISPAHSQTVDTVYQDVVIAENTENYFDSLEKIPGALVPHSIPDSVIEKMRNDDDYWYANMPPPRKQVKQEKKEDYKKSWMESSAVKNTVWVLLILIFAAILFWFLYSSNIRLFEPRPKPLVDETSEVSVEDLFKINYDTEIRNAVMAANYRLATRLWYLRTLRDLTGKKLISYQHDKTNTEYLDELYSSPYYKEFFRLTRNFEYAWYGKFQMTEKAYAIVEKDFSEFNRHIVS